LISAGAFFPHFTFLNTHMCVVLFYKGYKHKTYWFNCSSDVPNAVTPTPHCLQCVTTVAATGTAVFVSLLWCLFARYNATHIFGAT
jgi:hypothetical protein